MSDIEEDNEPMFQSEAAAFQRAGPGGLLNSLLSPETIDKLNKAKGGFQLFPPEDQFLLDVDRTCRDLMDNDVKLTQRDIDNLLTQTKYTNIRYKNATCYILGYIATRGGDTLTTSSIQKVITEVLPKVREDQGIYPADVVRYARLWIGSLGGSERVGFADS